MLELGARAVPRGLVLILVGKARELGRWNVNLLLQKLHAELTNEWNQEISYQKPWRQSLVCQARTIW